MLHYCMYVALSFVYFSVQLLIHDQKACDVFHY